MNSGLAEGDFKKPNPNFLCSQAHSSTGGSCPCVQSPPGFPRLRLMLPFQHLPLQDMGLFQGVPLQQFPDWMCSEPALLLPKQHRKQSHLLPALCQAQPTPSHHTPWLFFKKAHRRNQFLGKENSNVPIINTFINLTGLLSINNSDLLK